MPDTRVFLRDCPSYDSPALLREVRAILSATRLPVEGASILLKPSFVYPSRMERCRPISTQPEVVAAVTRVLYELGAARVTIAEDCLLGPSEVGFAAMGLRDHLGDLGDLLPLQTAQRATVEVEAPLIEERFVVPAAWLEADLFISLPKVKVNLYTDVTLSVKNNFGFLLERHRLPNHHHNLHKKIADLYKVRPPDFVIVDAIIAGEGQGPMSADPVPLGLLLGSKSSMAVDTVSCHLMGFEPREIEHLRLLHEAGFGPIDLAEVDVEDPELLATRARHFRRPSADLSVFEPHVRTVVGSGLVCPAGCHGMIRNTLDQWMAEGRMAELDGITFVVGSPVSPEQITSRRRTIVVGDCAMAHQRRGTFIPGCPVPPLSIAKVLALELARKGKMIPLHLRYRDLLRGVVARVLRRPL